MQGNIYIGTSGWCYTHWRHRFYPRTLPVNEYLRFYTRHFAVTEINTTFYQQPEARIVHKWRKSVPSSFVFCPKMYRGITHEHKLLQPEKTLPPFFASIAPLKDQAGPILIQLPPSLDFQPAVAENFFRILQTWYGAYTYALEIRHSSWLQQEAIDMLKDYGIGFVIAASGNKWPSAEIITSKHVYARFHGPDGSYGSCYTDDVLTAYAARIQAWAGEGHTTWSFFNNDGNGYAVQNARSLQTAVNGPQFEGLSQLALF